MKVDTNLSEEEFLDKMKSKGIKLAALSSYYHSSEKKKKYENIYVMNYSFVDCENGICCKDDNTSGMTWRKVWREKDKMTLRKKLMLSLFIQPWNGTGKCVRFDL